MSDYDAPLSTDQPHQQPWRVVTTKTVIDAWPWVRLSEEDVRLPNGVAIPNFYRIEMSDYVKIFALTPDRQVVVEEAYKHGPRQVSWELPAGGIEDDESDPVEAAKRELLEETGYVAASWTPLGRYFVDGNRGCCWMYGFLARGAVHQQAPQPEATELLQTHLLSLDTLRRMWLDGTIHNVASTALIGLALAHLDTNR